MRRRRPRPRPGLHRSGRAGAPAPRSRSSTGRPGCGPTSTASARCSTRVEEHAARSGATTPAARVATLGGGLTGGRGSARCWPGCRRKVLGQYELFAPGADAARTAAAGRAEHRGRRAGAGGRPADFRLWVCLHEETHRVQFGAVPWLRDHLVGEIHGLLTSIDSRPGAVARARPGGRRRARRELRRGGEGRPSPTSCRRRSRRASSTASPRSCPCSRVTPTSSWTASAPRSCRRSPTSASGSSTVAAARRPRTPRCAGCSAWTPSCASTATARGSCAASSTRVGMTGFNRVWDEPAEPAHPRGDRPTRPAWVARVHPDGMSGPPPPVAASDAPSAQALADLEPGDLVLVACSGGADSLALAAAAVLEAPPRRRAGRRGHRRPRSAGRLAPTRALAVATQLRALGLRPRRGGRGPGRPGGRTRGRRPASPACRPRRGRGPARRSRRPARPHPRRPGGDGAAGAGPRVRGPLARRHGAPSPAGCVGRC